MEYSFNYDSPIEATSFSKEDNDLIIEGTAIDTTRNGNGWGIRDTELDSLNAQFNQKRQFRVDHSKHYRDIVGYVDGSEKKNDSIRYRARIHDPIVQRILLKNPTAHHVSIGALAKSITCSKCGNRSKPYRTCKCKDAYDIVAGLKLMEISLITDPAYENTDAQPVGFSASLTAALNDFAPKKEYKCDLSPSEERICEYIKECNPNTKWNLAAAKELYSDFTNEFMKTFQRYDVAQATDKEIKSEQKMSTNIKASEEEVKKADTQTYNTAPGGSHIPFGKDAPKDNQFEQKLKEETVEYNIAPAGKNIPVKTTVPSEKGFEQTLHEREDEVRKREDEVRRREDELRKKETLGKEYGTGVPHSGKGGVEDKHPHIKTEETVDEVGKGVSHDPKGGIHDQPHIKHEDATNPKNVGSEGGGGSAIMVLSKQMEELSKKFEEAVKKFEEYHESDETKREDDEVTKVGKKMEEMSNKLEELVKREEVFHKKKEDDEAKKKEEDEAKKKEDEAKKEASSAKKYTIGGKVAPPKEGTEFNASNIVQDAWSEVVTHAKEKKPEWELPN